MNPNQDNIYAFFLGQMSTIVSQVHGFPRERLEVFLHNANVAYLRLSRTAAYDDENKDYNQQQIYDFWDSADSFFYSTIRYDNFETAHSARVIPNDFRCPKTILSYVSNTWHVRYHESSEDKKITCRASLSVYPHPDLIKALDAFILEDCGEYKFPQVFENSPPEEYFNEFMNRIDPVTFYFYNRPDPVTLVRMYEAIRPFLKRRENANGHCSFTVFPGLDFVDHDTLKTNEVFYAGIAAQCPQAKHFADESLKQNADKLQNKISPGMQMTWEKIIALYRQYTPDAPAAVPAPVL